jgi:hypothetical protein
MIQQEAELGKGHAEPILCFASPCGGYVRRWKSMFPGKSMWQLKVTRISALSLKSVLALLERVPAPLQCSPLPYLWKRRGAWGMLAENREGLAPIVKAYSRLILVDGLVL